MSYYIKSTLLIIIICITAFAAKAQLADEYSKADIGIGADINVVYGDVETPTHTKSVHFNYGYNIGPFLNYIVEFQSGELRGGDSLTTVSGRQFLNKFTSVIFRTQVQAGEFIDYSQGPIANAAKNLYLSTGIGFIVNHITSINRYSFKIPGYYTPGEDNSNQILIPLRIGYELKIFDKYDHPSFKIDLAYQHNFVLGDGVDGYRVGGKLDHYAQYSLGVKFAIGGIASYRKQIKY